MPMILRSGRAKNSLTLLLDILRQFAFDSGKLNQGSDGDNFYRQTFFGRGRHDPLFFYRCLRPLTIRDEGDKRGRRQ